MPTNHIIGGFVTQGLGKQSWWVDSATLLDYGHKFMVSLHVMNNKSYSTWVLPYCNFVGYLSVVNSL